VLGEQTRRWSLRAGSGGIVGELVLAMAQNFGAAKSHKGLMCGIVSCFLLLFSIPIALFLTCRSGCGNDPLTRLIMDEETYPVPGDAAKFKPFDALAGIRERVGKDARLTEVEIWLVRSDGTVDLTATYTPSPRVLYTFVRPAKNPPAEMPPIGAGRKEGDIWLEEVKVECFRPGQVRHVKKMGGSVNKEYRFSNEGMVLTFGSPSMGTLPEDLGSPKVSVEEIWSVAIGKGAPKEAVARITWSSRGYEFRVDGWDSILRWDETGDLRD
jgi:hypothetical protein